MGGEIVFNRLFAGSFLDEHIGHEIVNLYKDDNGDNYVYIQPYGTFSRNHSGKIEYVLLVRGVNGRQSLEVLGLATGLTEIFSPFIPPQHMWMQHLKFLKDNRIAYGGALIMDIFNREKESVDKQPVYLSMKAANVVRPCVPVFIVFPGGRPSEDPSAINVQLTDTQQAKCSLKQYLSKTEKDYSAVLNLIQMENLWVKDTEPIIDCAGSEIEEDSFWNVCAIEDYELAWSSALAYFMRKYPQLVVDFAKEKLNIAIRPFFDIRREVDNIDILLENEEEIVVVENKITSKINGIQVKDDKLVGTQLMKYHFRALERACGLSSTICDYSQWRACMESCGKKVSCFLLSPNYNRIDLSRYDTPFDVDNPRSPIFRCKEYYQEILYRDVYGFLQGRYPDDIYFQEMLKGMKRHTLDYHNDLFDDTKKKFLRQIRRLKK